MCHITNTDGKLEKVNHSGENLSRSAFDSSGKSLEPSGLIPCCHEETLDIPPLASAKVHRRHRSRSASLRLTRKDRNAIGPTPRAHARGWTGPREQ
jgi:hypothetical protein